MTNSRLIHATKPPNLINLQWPKCGLSKSGRKRKVPQMVNPRHFLALSVSPNNSLEMQNSAFKVRWWNQGPNVTTANT